MVPQRRPQISRSIANRIIERCSYACTKFRRGSVHNANSDTQTPTPLETVKFGMSAKRRRIHTGKVIGRLKIEGMNLEILDCSQSKNARLTRETLACMFTSERISYAIFGFEITLDIHQLILLIRWIVESILDLPTVPTHCRGAHSWGLQYSQLQARRVFSPGLFHISIPPRNFTELFPYLTGRRDIPRNRSGRRR